jgi:hypothetical protein
MMETLQNSDPLSALGVQRKLFLHGEFLLTAER